MKILHVFIPIFLFSSFLFIACSQTNGIKLLDHEKQYDIHLVKARMVFPDFFEVKSFEELARAMDLADSSQMPDTARRRAAREGLSGVNYFILADTLNPYSNISIFPIDHIVMDKVNAGVYLHDFQEKMEEDRKKYGIDFKRLENKLMNCSNSQMLKLHYQIHHAGAFQYLTQYVVSTKKNSFIVNIRMYKDIDFDYFMAKMSFIK